jgi:hypothetical protein
MHVDYETKPVERISPYGRRKKTKECQKFWCRAIAFSKEQKVSVQLSS